MASKGKLPLVAICGRPNVGKSTLFNRLTRKQSAIVHDEEGITRDRAYANAEYEGRAFRVVDTGGIVDNPAESIMKKTQAQVRAALDEANVIIFVLDGQQDITRGDLEIRDELFKYNKPVVLAINKLDNATMEQNSVEFFALGIGEPIAISSGHGHGIDLLMDAVVAHFPKVAPVTEIIEEEPPKKVTKVAIIGRPNVGKSSFINAILNEERTIVDDTPGTTRDAIDIDFHWRGKDYLLIDTAGMRKKAGITRFVERFSVSRSLRAVQRADVCLVMIDAVEGLSEQDKRITGYAHENGAAMVLAWTKWDLVQDKEARFKAIADEIDLKAPFLKYVPYFTLSNLTRQRLFSAFEYVDRVADAANLRVSTADLNRLMDDVRAMRTPSGARGKTAKVKYATQVGVKPTTFILFVNQKKLFHFSYIRFIENQIREKYGFDGVPIQIELREGAPRE